MSFISMELKNNTLNATNNLKLFLDKMNNTNQFEKLLELINKFENFVEKYQLKWKYF